MRSGENSFSSRSD